MIRYDKIYHTKRGKEMENEKLKKRKIMLSNSIIPWFIGISDDLMFYIAINTLFFTVVKQLSAASISFLTTASALFYILLQIPFLKIIQKIGNIRAIRMGTIMLLISSILMTFGNNYIIILIGHIIYISSFLFKKMDNVVLKNNLQYLNKQDDYIKVSSKAKVIYAIVTTIIALTAGGIFAINHYLPMYLCIGVCIINVLLSYCIFDINENVKKENKTNKMPKITFSKIVPIILISFGLLYATIDIGQSNSKLFIQYNLEEYFDIGITASYLGFIIVTSRISRILGNIIFRKIYKQIKDKISLLLPIVAMVAFSCIFIGGCINSNIIIKFTIMTIGFDIILAIRDPYEVYMTDLLLKNTKVEEQQKAISYLQLSRRIGGMIISLIFSMLLTQLDLSYIIISLFILTVIALIINSKLYKLVKFG